MMQIRTSLSTRRGRMTAYAPGILHGRIAVQTNWRPGENYLALDVKAEHYAAAVALAESFGLTPWPEFVGVDNQGRHYWEAFANAEAGTPIE